MPDPDKDQHIKHLHRATPALAAPLPHDNRPADPDLTLVAERWADLPEAVRAGIVAMVKAASGKGDRR